MPYVICHTLPYVNTDCKGCDLEGMVESYWSKKLIIWGNTDYPRQSAKRLIEVTRRNLEEYKVSRELTENRNA